MPSSCTSPVRLLHHTPTDEDLVRQLAEGQCEALAPLHDRYATLLCNLAAGQLGRSTAEEVVQDVFTTVWQHARSFDPERGNFRPWVFQITRWRIMNELRRRRSRPTAHQEVAATLHAPLGTTKTRIRSGLLKLRVPLMSLVAV